MRPLTKRLAAIGLALGAATLGVDTARADGDGPGPVLMVIANQDFAYEQYAATRQSLEAAGLEVVVAAATTEVARPHAQSPGGRLVAPDRAIGTVRAREFSALVLVGGPGAVTLQDAFPGTYLETGYERDPRTTAALSRVIGEFVAEQKHVGAVCYGVSVLAWARVDGASPLVGGHIKVFDGSTYAHPSFVLDGRIYARGEVDVAWHFGPGFSGGVFVAAADLDSSGTADTAGDKDDHEVIYDPEGDLKPKPTPTSADGDHDVIDDDAGDLLPPAKPPIASDDVWIDGRIITAENAAALGEAIAGRVLAGR